MMLVAKILRITIGIFLCLSSVALGWLPLIPGVPLFLLGVALLAKDVPWVRRQVDRAKRKVKRWLVDRRRRKRDANRAGAGDS
ncbi:MAG: hypothetical protein HYR85_01970 [Planctomycetes bacterium]|nr:hypothetical protein [Planctomycetota bacterium]MBI3845707.1 hypothetical protein [Planctomycetota bacterium]